jgi:hypothetical protein
MWILLIILAALWGAVAVELVIESARVDGAALVAFGVVLATPPVAVTIVVLCLVSASAALALAVAVAYVRGRRLERRMAAELDARWAELAEREGADKARTELLMWRVNELQTMVDHLLEERAEQPPRHLIVVPERTDVITG